MKEINVTIESKKALKTCTEVFNFLNEKMEEDSSYWIFVYICLLNKISFAALNDLKTKGKVKLSGRKFKKAFDGLSGSMIKTISDNIDYFNEHYFS